MRNSRTKLVSQTGKPSPKNATRSSNGWMLTNWLRSRNSKTNKRKLKAFVIQSSQNCTKQPGELQEVCQVVCQEVCPVVCQAVCLVVCQEPVQDRAQVVQEDQPSKKLIKQYLILQFTTYCHYQ